MTAGSLPVPLQDTTQRVIRSSQGSKSHLTLFLYHLGHSWTLQDTLESITQNQSKGQRGPCPPGKAQITVCFSSKPGTIPMDNVEACPNRYSNYLQQSTGHYMTSNYTPWEYTNSAFTLAPAWTLRDCTSLYGKHTACYGARSLWLCVWQGWWRE